MVLRNVALLQNNSEKGHHFVTFFWGHLPHLAFFPKANSMNGGELTESANQTNVQTDAWVSWVQMHTQHGCETVVLCRPLCQWHDIQETIAWGRLTTNQHAQFEILECSSGPPKPPLLRLKLDCIPDANVMK